MGVCNSDTLFEFEQKLVGCCLSMNWFIRWTVSVVILVLISVLVWWFIFVDKRPDEFWLVLLYTGVGTIFIGGLMTIGASESVEESDSVFPYSSFKSPSIKSVDITEHSGSRINRLIEAAPAVWAFVVVGIFTISIGLCIKAFIP